MTKLTELSNLGQSVWFDYIRRQFLIGGGLDELIAQGLRGVTSNPSIFEKAIAGSNDYDDSIRTLAQTNASTEDIYESLVLEDIRQAADMMLPVYKSSQGNDGFVSLEVSPKLAYDTEGTIAEAKRLFNAVDRVNLMIKVPATKEGIPAVRELISSGISVNVTLLFGVEMYQMVTGAYLDGLEKLAESGPRVENGHAVDSVRSVASFFVSRIDNVVDALLEKAGNEQLKGKIAIDNAKNAYSKYLEVFGSDRWKRLAEKGASEQRLLWASTGTKNPAYPDTLYVDMLIGKNTVNTVPPATLSAFMDHGTVRETLQRGYDEAVARLEQLSALRIDLASITEKLLSDGVESFEKAFDSLMDSISEKRERLTENVVLHSSNLGAYQTLITESLKKLKKDDILNRIWWHDHSVWKNDPDDITNRLGWLHSPEVMNEMVPQMKEFSEQVRSEGFQTAVLLGMGGSSLAPEVFRKVFGLRKGYLDLHVLDTTDPKAILSLEKDLDLKTTLFIVSTKSGGTVETISFMKHFYGRIMEKHPDGNPGAHFVAITDPGSSLEETAGGLNFRKTFLNDPHIGGRYSALSYFGLLPAALIGVDLKILLDRALTMACNAEGYNCPVEGDNTPAELGVLIGELAKKGRDKLTIVASPSIAQFGDWLEQLIAESTGKEDTGVVPVSGEALLDPSFYADDRVFVYLKLAGEDQHDAAAEALENAGYPIACYELRDLYDIGGEFFRWEMAVAIAGSILGINPFDQPNVEAAKVLAREMVDRYQETGILPEEAKVCSDAGVEVFFSRDVDGIQSALRTFLDNEGEVTESKQLKPYVALQAFIQPTENARQALESLRTEIQKKYKVATTLGFGPRFLHSTGQLHKGDGGNGLFIQFTSEVHEDLSIPDEAGDEKSGISFGVLKSAQALGDKKALEERGRSVIRFHLDNIQDGLSAVHEALTSL